MHNIFCLLSNYFMQTVAFNREIICNNIMISVEYPCAPVSGSLYHSPDRGGRGKWGRGGEGRDQMSPLIGQNVCHICTSLLVEMFYRPT